MAQVTLDQIMTDALSTAEAVTGITEGYWPPPDQGPTQGPVVWLDCGPVDVEQGNLEIAIVTITFTVAMPNKGKYGDNYKRALEYAQKIQRAFRANTQVAGEAIVLVGGQMQRPRAGIYAETSVVVCEYVMQVQTLDEVVNEIAL